MKNIPKPLTRSEFRYSHQDKVAEHYGYEKWDELSELIFAEDENGNEPEGEPYEIYTKWHIQTFSKLKKALE